jgi:hypothetical protein
MNLLRRVAHPTSCCSTTVQTPSHLVPFVAAASPLVAPALAAVPAAARSPSAVECGFLTSCTSPQGLPSGDAQALSSGCLLLLLLRSCHISGCGSAAAAAARSMLGTLLFLPSLLPLLRLLLLLFGCHIGCCCCRCCCTPCCMTCSCRPPALVPSILSAGRTHASNDVAQLQPQRGFAGQQHDSLLSTRCLFLSYYISFKRVQGSHNYALTLLACPHVHIGHILLHTAMVSDAVPPSAGSCQGTHTYKGHDPWQGIV